MDHSLQDWKQRVKNDNTGSIRALKRVLNELEALAQDMKKDASAWDEGGAREGYEMGPQSSDAYFAVAHWANTLEQFIKHHRTEEGI